MEEKLTMENDEVVLVRKDGSKVQLDKLITFDDEANKKSYIIYTDNSKDENGNVRISASIVKDPTNPNSELEEIKTEREWKVIDTVLKSTMESVRKHMEKKNEE
ncbi:MAG: DUF1292 domain-containing protein [Bacilli bacterium]|nr:DUF1292 domain-containing protein [Bacilli bacterium]